MLDWISPRGQPLNPPLTRNIKINRGFHHERTGFLLCPAGLDWSNLEYEYISLFDCSLTSHRIKDKLRSGEMAVKGDHWPIFLYQDHTYDPSDPWNGLFRNAILVSVRVTYHDIKSTMTWFALSGLQTHFHLSKFGREGAQGHAIRQCPYPWNDTSHNAVNRICSHPGKWLSCLSVFLGIHQLWCRSDSHCLRRRYFLEQTWRQTPRDSMIQF